MSQSLTPFAESARNVALPAGEPGWLAALRRDALAAFAARGLPDTRNELWKYTSLRALQQRAMATPDADAAIRAAPVELTALAPATGTRVVFVNGVFRADLSSFDGTPEGVTLEPLSHALQGAAEPLRFLLGSTVEDDDGFVLLNRALATEGLLLRVADGVDVQAPIEIVHCGVAAAASAAWHLRVLVEIGCGAKARIVERHLGDGAGHLANIVAGLTLREGAGLDWTLLQHASRESTLLRRSDCVLHDDASLDFHALELGGKLARHELRVDLAGARARFASRGAFVLHGRQHADSEVLVTHRGRDSVSDSLWRGVAGERARGVVHGRIHVQPGADGSDGSFYNKNLLLSADAEIDTRPALEIYADEVKANHGATVGQLDEKSLFYLRSRGVPLDLARRMLVRAFCAVTLDGIAPAALREECEALLLAQLPEAAE